MPSYQITSKFKECVLSEIEKKDVVNSDEEMMLYLLKAVKKCKKYNKKIPAKQRLATVGRGTLIEYGEVEGKSW